MSEPRGSEPTSQRDSGLIAETLLVIALALGLILVGTVALTILAGGAVGSVPAFLAGAFGLRSVIWAVGTIVIAVLLRNNTRKLRMRLSLLVAALAVAAATLINLGPGTPLTAQALGFAPVVWILDLASFMVCALLGWLLAIRLLDAPTGRRTGSAILIVTTVFIALGGVGIFALFMQWLELYFTIWSSERETYEDFGPEGVRYLLTAGFSLAILITAIVLSVLRKARGLVVLASVLLAICLVAAFVFQVPTGRFIPKPVTYELPDDYTPCYGGEGDPGCEGG